MAPRLLACATVFVLGCGDGDEATPSDASTVASSVPAPQIRDSSGVRIVTYRSLQGADTLSWRLDMNDTVRIGRFGTSEADTAYVLGMPMGALRLADGRVAVTDLQTSSVRVFEADGTWSRNVGRRGGGPGEFERLWPALLRPGDSLLVPGSGFRITTFSPDLELVGTRRLEMSDWGGVQYPEIRGVFGDGTLLLLTRSERDRVTRLHRADREGRSLADFGVRPTPGSHSWEAPNPYNRAPRWFASASSGPQFAVHGDRLHWTDVGIWEIRTYRLDGTLERILRFDRDALQSSLDPRIAGGPLEPDVEVPAEIEAAIKAERDSVGVSPFQTVTVDRMGNLWLREQSDRNDDPEDPSRWYVFDPAGMLTHVVRMPFWWRGATQIGDDHVLAMEWHELGVITYLTARLLRN